MVGLVIISGLTVFFSATTVAVLAYPLIKLLPSWMERRLNRRIACHHDALEAFEAALAAPDLDSARRARLVTERSFHLCALQALTAAEVAPTVTGPLPIDIAA